MIQTRLLNIITTLLTGKDASTTATSRLPRRPQGKSRSASRSCGRGKMCPHCVDCVASVTLRQSA
jgi:hypothetical protein